MSASASSSFFASPSTPQQPSVPASVERATTGPHGGRHMQAASVTGAAPGRLGFDLSVTPMGRPGQLSFTPAMSHAGFTHGRRTSGGSYGGHGASSFFDTPSAAQQQQQQQQAQQSQAQVQQTALPAHRSMRSVPAPSHAAAVPPYSTTPSHAVPLDFPTPRGRVSDSTARPAAAAMQFPSYRPHAGRPAGAAAAPLPLSAFASGLPSSAGGYKLGAANKLQLAKLLGGDGAFGVATALPPLPPGPPIRIPRAPLRALIASCLARGHLGGAVFYADKLATLENFSPASVLQLAGAYARDGQHQRAVHLLRKHQLMHMPKCNIHEWRRQQLDHEQKQARARQQRLTSHRSAASDDDDPAAASPLTVRLECLYLGLQSLLQLKAHEEALRDGLPEDDADASSLEESDEEARSWEAALMQVLAAVAPVPAESAAGETTNAVEATAATVRDIIGAEEVALILTLLKYQRVQRESEARIRQADAHLGSAGQEVQDDADYGGPIDLCASLCYIRGSVYESQSHKYKAILWFKLCLHFDVRHMDAFERLTSKRLLSVQEEQQLFSSNALHFPPALEWLKLVWLNRIDVEQIDTFEQQQQVARGVAVGGATVSTTAGVHKALLAASGGQSATNHAAPSPTSSLLSRYRLLSVTYQLGDNHDLLSSVIAHRYAQGEYTACLSLCERVQEADPFLLSILPTFLACLVELQHKSRLFFVAHRLVSAYPRRAISWHAVGCYYLLLGALDVARRFFYKATRMDGLSPYAWVGFGHTFSYQDESEQALLAYRTAHRLFEGAHVPLLCMGQEYLRTNHLLLARHFLTAAISANPHDPLPHNELGVLAFKSGHMQEAVRAFLTCLSLVKHEALQQWEPTLFNLGHAYRKMGRYPEAVSAYNRALSVSPRGFSILCALGFTCHLQGSLTSAIHYYHQALGMHPRDAFATDMLERALNELADHDLDQVMHMHG